MIGSLEQQAINAGVDAAGRVARAGARAAGPVAGGGLRAAANVASEVGAEMRNGAPEAARQAHDAFVIGAGYFTNATADGLDAIARAGRDGALREAGFDDVPPPGDPNPERVLPRPDPDGYINHALGRMLEGAGLFYGATRLFRRATGYGGGAAAARERLAGVGGGGPAPAL
jgi:hypothetical protein